MNENNYFNLELNYFRYLNLAMVHNKYPIAKNITIENKSGETYQNLTLEITPGVDFAKGASIEIPKIEVGERIDLNVKNEVNQGFVLQLTEELKSDFTITI